MGIDSVDVTSRWSELAVMVFVDVFINGRVVKVFMEEIVHEVVNNEINGKCHHRVEYAQLVHSELDSWVIEGVVKVEINKV
jgi:hypothetical protein